MHFLDLRVAFLFLIALFCASSSLHARLGVEYQTGLGRPTDAAVDAARRTDYLIPRSQFVLSYNDDTRQANWVGWSLSNEDRGLTDRTDAWSVETLLPSGYLRVGTATFGTGWDRGHMAPSADRTLTDADNRSTFVMSNIIPQASRNNQGLWGDFESYCRLTLAADGSEVLILSGPSEFGGTMLSNGMAIPNSVWKIAVKVPAGNGTAAQRVHAGSRVIALLTPNLNDPNLGPWQGYITSVEEIEALTGFDFFRDIAAVNPGLATYLKNVVDTGTGPNAPTVITSFSPTSGAPGTPVTLSGYHFAADSTVRFNGVAATATVLNSGTQISTSVPAGATTGEISIVSTNGTDSSGAVFTVWSSNEPSIALSTVGLAGLAATEGAPGLSKSYTLSGANLGGVVTLNATAGFEVSLNNTAFAQSVSVSPAGGVIVNVPVYVRLSASAPVGPIEGQVVHSSAGVQPVAMTISGEVLSNLPTLSLSAYTLSGFTAVEGVVGNQKTYTLSGYNLSGNVTIQAPENFEVSTSGSSYGPSVLIIPSGSTLAATPVSVRLKSTAPLGAHTGNITHSGGGAAAKILAVSGMVGVAENGETAEVYWNFTTAAPSSNQTVTFSVGELSRGNNLSGTMALLTSNSASTSYPGASGGNNAGAAARIGPLNTAENGSAYFEFTVTPASGVNFTLTGLSFGSRSTSTAPVAYELRNSSDNFSSTTAAGTFLNDSKWVEKSHSGLAVSSNATTTFRLYGFNGTGSPLTSTANWRIDDLRLNFSTSVAANATPPVIDSPDVAAATAFSPFAYQITATNSPTSFAASGLPEGLTCNPATGSISGTPTMPGSYLATLTASNARGDGSATLSITVSTNPLAAAITGNLSATGQLRAPFDFQVAATNSPKAYLASGLPAGLSIDSATGRITGTPSVAGIFNASLTVQNDYGSDTKTFHVVVSDPVLSLSQQSLGGFSANLGAAGGAAGYSLSGSDLTGNITVLAPPNFEISAGGGVYSESLTLSPSSGSIAANLLVRLSANATLGAQEGSLIHSGGGAVPKYLAVSGNVTAPVPTLSLSTTALEPFSTTVNKTSIFQTYTIGGGGLSGNVTIQAPEGFELRKEGGIDFSNSLSLAPVGGFLAQTTIEVRLAARSSAGAFSGQITHSTTGVAVATVAVSGNVSSVAAPVILMSGSGSTYRGRSYSLQIRVEGSIPVIGYGATGLPPGVSINTATGRISGTATSNGTFPLVLSASGEGGTTTANYTLLVRDPTADSSAPVDVAINKFRNNGTSDIVELLVTARGVRGGTVDLRGMVLKDFSSNMGADLGGKFVFSNAPMWRAVKAGTLIVLSSSNATEDFSGSDFILRANLFNPDLFTVAAGGFDIANTEMVLLKAAGTGADGYAGGIHALSVGSTGTQYTSFTGRKLNASNALSSSKPFGFVINNSSALADFYSSSGGDTSRSLTFGAGNNAKNTSFIQSLRVVSNTPPVLTLNGTNPMTIAHGTVYAEPGATAYDAEDGSRPVTISGVVNPMLVGNYTVTYRTTDSGNLTTTVNRTVFVTDQTPPIISLNGNATLEVPFGGPFLDPGASANDAVDGAVAVSVSGTVNPFAAGTYFLVYSAKDAAGNTSPGTTRTVSVGKGAPTISQSPAAAPIAFGAALSASALSGGTASVAGSFAWTHPNTIPPAGVGNFSVTFLPTDSGNFTTATAFATLTVTPQATAFESWAVSQGLSGANAASNADPDRDGWSNSEEFAFGLDPNTSGGHPLSIVQTPDGRVKVVFIQRNGLTYTIRLANRLEDGFVSTLDSTRSEDQSALPSPDLTRREVLLPQGERAFIKIEATTP